MEKLALARRSEEDALVQDVLDAILENNRIAKADGIPICQDTGTTVIFAQLGNRVCFEGFSLQEAADEAAIAAQKCCPLRASMVSDPLFERKNTLANQPALLSIKQVEGDGLRLKIAQKGGGAENMSFLMMLSPTTPVDEIKELIVERIVASGSRPCPPLVVGIGIGGNFERCAALAKEALFEPLGRPHPDENYARVEREILAELNIKGSGAQGMGGLQTALAVHI